MTATVDSAVTVRAAPNRDSQTVARNSLTLLVRQAVLWGLNGIMVLFLPRYLGAEGLGQIQFAISFTAVFEVAVTLGVRQFLIKEIARDRSQAANYLGTAIGTRLLTTALVFVIILAVAQATGYSSTAKAVIMIAAGTMCVTAFSRLLTGFMHGREDMSSPAISEVAGKVLVLAAAIPVLVTGQGVVAYAVVLLAGMAVTMALNAYFVSRTTPLRISFQMDKAKTLLVGGLPFLFMAFILEVYNHGDVIILRTFTSETVTGWYAAALQFYRAAELFPLVLTTALLPTLARLHTSDTEVLAGIARKSIAIGGLVVIPVALGLSLLADEVITFLPYPETFDNSVLLLSILALTIPITAFLTILGTIAIAVDRQKVWAYALLFTLALDLVLNILLVPYFERVHGNGGIGAAITTVGAEVVMVAVGLRLMPRGVLDTAMRNAFLKIALAAAVMAAIGLFARWMDFAVPVLVALGAMAYLGTIFLTRAVTVEDAAFMREAVLGRLLRSRKGEA